MKTRQQIEQAIERAEEIGTSTRDAGALVAALSALTHATLRAGTAIQDLQAALGQSDAEGPGFEVHGL